VESALATHAEILESAVIALPDSDLGEAVTAVVVLKGPGKLHPRDIIAHCAERLTCFKVPKTVLIVPELPRTGSGKIFKRKLREEYGRAS
jgi:acyl-coenzyme A synthetase/AMP-(fatty) acid ligase